MSCVAIIPARGGSKGIPLKNLQPVGGLPLVVRAIRVAQQARCITQVVVSTDHPQIAQVSRQAGATVFQRPESLSGDMVPSEAALLHVLGRLQQQTETLPEVTCFVQCTSPFTTADDLERGYARLMASQADSLISVTPFYHFVWHPDPERGLTGVNHPVLPRLRRQDRAPEYLETGAFYLFQTRRFLTEQTRFMGRISWLEMPPERALEIDTWSDLQLANALWPLVMSPPVGPEPAPSA